MTRLAEGRSVLKVLDAATLSLLLGMSVMVVG